MQTDLSSKRQINHKTMRVIVGIIALFLSPTVWIIAPENLTSISISYWTDSHDIFVGSLIVVGFFLSAYNGMGNGRDWEYWLSKAACVFAVCVALFPTKGFFDTDKPANWIQAFANFIGLTPRFIHNASAILLFACLVGLLIFFSRRAKKKNKHLRAKVYLVLNALMICGMGIVYLVVESINRDDSIFWVEAWGLSFFGMGWFVAGTYRSETPT